jgi:hypothetical protein
MHNCHWHFKKSFAMMPPALQGGWETEARGGNKPSKQMMLLHAIFWGGALAGAGVVAIFLAYQGFKTPRQDAQTPEPGGTSRRDEV